MNKEILVEIKHLKKYFPVKKKIFSKKQSLVKAVDDVSFYIEKGETLGLVGESGCGKTTLGRTIIKLYEPTFGEIIFQGQNIENLNNSQMIPFRKDMQMIFQDPYASLDPRMTISEIIGEALTLKKEMKTSEKNERILNILNLVGLNNNHASRYPHEFSGGQRQRIGIARALSVEPKFIICDEPISALDVSIQAQIVNMLEDLQNNFSLTYLFIAHDLSMVKHISNRVGVMYLGNLVELARSNELYKNPMHPYTKSLLSVIPIPDPDKLLKIKRQIIEGEIPSSMDPPPGCKFKSRCKYVKNICKEISPELKNMGENHFVSCHLFN